MPRTTRHLSQGESICVLFRILAFQIKIYYTTFLPICQQFFCYVKNFARFGFNSRHCALKSRILVPKARSRKKVVAKQRRNSRVYKRIADLSVPFAKKQQQRSLRKVMTTPKINLIFFKHTNYFFHNFKIRIFIVF